MQRAIWYIETHLGEALDVERIARAVGVDRFRLSRQFTRATGSTVQRYLLDRRLAQAAHRLAAGERDILSLALDAGYGSHEAFTRALEERFDRTPSEVRCTGTVAGLMLQEPIAKTDTMLDLPDPVIIEAPARHLLGLRVHYPDGPSGALPGQWVRFNTLSMPTGMRRGHDAWGICQMVGDDGGFDYACAVETEPDVRAPGFERIDLPPTRYAVFRHAGHVSEVRRSWVAIMDAWLPGASWTMASAPDLERYGPEFDPDTGEGGLELWVPVIPRSI